MATNQATSDTSFKIGDAAMKAMVQPFKREELDKKWGDVPARPQPTPEQQETIRMIDERWSSAKNAKQKRHDIWNFSYLQYRSVNYYSLLYGGFPTYWNSWGQGVFIPRTFETIESMKVQMLGTDPDFYLKPVGPQKDQTENWLQHITKSEWDRSKIGKEIKDTVHDGLVYGAGIVRTDVINDKRQEFTMSWQEDGSIKYTEEVVQKYFGVGGRRVDPYDFYPDPSPEMNSIDDLTNKGGYSFERSVTDAWELREEYRILAEAGALGTTDQWQYLMPGGDCQDVKYLRREVDTLYNATMMDQRYPGTVNDLVGRTSTIFGTKSLQSKDKIELLDYWERDRHIISTGTGLILLDSPNPYPHKRIPYAKWNVINGNQFWNMGVPEYMKSLQIVENVLYDQGLNNIVMAVHKMFAVNSRYLVDEGELVVRPFGIIHLKQIPGIKLSDAIMPIEYSTEMNSYFSFMQKNTDNIQKVTGTSEFQTGAATSQANTDTATVANRLAFAGASRISEVSRHIEEDMTTTVVEHMVANIQFYYQNVDDKFEDGHLPVKIAKSAGQDQWMKYLPKNSTDITEEDHNQATDEGFSGIIAQDQIQGRMTVAVKGGSSLPVDPDKKKAQFANFAKFAQTATISSQQSGPVDPATGQPQMITVQTPVFDFAKVAMMAAEEVFDIPDPEEYAYKASTPDQTQTQQPTAPADPAATAAIPEAPGEMTPTLPDQTAAPAAPQQ